MQSYKPYIDFIRYSIGSLSAVPDSSKEIEWAEFYAFCQRQGITGLVFAGLERSGLHIPQEVLFEWLSVAQTIQATNRIVDSQCRKVSRFWDEKGFPNCILKGQACATMYPQPEMRTPGDIDIWVEGNPADIIRIAQEEAPKGHYSLHHVTMPVFKDTQVEVHYRPVFLDNWCKDKLLQKYIDEVKHTQFNNAVMLNDGKTVVHALTDDFNAVFLLLHMWHHLLSTRNNLKQLIDYYFLLKRDIPIPQREQIATLFHRLGVYKYARGIMWMMNKILGLPVELLIVPPDEKIGRLVFQETLNFTGKEEDSNRLHILVNSITSNKHLFLHFPSSVLIRPIYLVWHQWWKVNMKRKLESTSA
jgi:hypothetical protein